MHQSLIGIYCVALLQFNAGNEYPNTKENDQKAAPLVEGTNLPFNWRKRIQFESTSERRYPTTAWKKKRTHTKQR